MLPTNVMSFMKKMVATNESAGGGTDPEASGTALSKLRQTLSSSLMTAQDKVTKLSPARQAVSSATDSSAATPPDERAASKPEDVKPKADPTKPPCRTGACRVCLKSFKPEDFFRTCCECTQKVCEDCASYSKLDENQDESTWRCSICRRKLQSRNVQPVMAQESTDSLLDVPVLEALQRRHSDVKIGSGSNLTVGGGGLAPPRSPELRRHSDVSPASLKELEKVAGERREELRWERELEWRQHRHPHSPQVERRPFPDERWDRKDGRDSEGRQVPPAVPSVTTQDDDSEAEAWRRQRARGRRQSRVTRQRSYDEELKTGNVGGGGEPNLGLPVQLPRRASAYDVYASRGGDGGGLNPAAVAAAVAASRQQPDPKDLTSRRPSFRIPKPSPADKADDSQNEPTQSPMSPEATAQVTVQLGVEEDRRTRRRTSQLPDLGQRALPQTPPSSGAPTPRSSETSDVVRRQTSVTDGEAIKIVIHDVDSDTGFSSRPGAKRRVILRRDPSDKAHRTRGFGMRVVGGKTGSDGRLFAYIVWTVPGGPAEKGGLQQGDKVLEWDGVALVDRSFEEVCAVMDRAGEVADLLVEHATDLRMCDLLDEPPLPRKSPAENLGSQLESEQDKAPTSPTRRKLPKTPEQMAREKAVSGRVQLQVFYHDERHELVVSVLAADDLPSREDTGYGALPEAFLKLRLLPVTSEQTTIKSSVAEPTQNPIWNATFDFPNVPGEDLMDRTIEVTLWDFCPDKDSVFLGECAVDLKKAFLEDRPVWYRLEDPRGIRASGGKSPQVSPRSSLAGEVAQRLLRRTEFQRSFSDDKDSDERSGGSPEPSLLHPDHAWLAMGSACSSRRGSSQSEQLEVESYQLGRDFSRSLPGSRRSSFQSQQGDTMKDTELPPATYNKERRRSSCTRPARDPDEILRSLKAVKGELQLGRAMSFSEKARRRCSADSILIPQRQRQRAGSGVYLPPRQLVWGSRRESMLADVPLPQIPQPTPGIAGSPSDDEERWSVPEVQLGPGQIQPRGYRLTSGRYGEVRLGLLMTKGQLEVEVVTARNFACEDRENPPDTYVKTYLRDGDRWLQKRKTRVVRHSLEPQFRQTLRYNACDVLGRALLVMLWERQPGFEHNVGRGGAEVALDKLTLTQPTHAWYPLFPLHSLGSDSNDSP